MVVNYKFMSLSARTKKCEDPFCTLSNIDKGKSAKRVTTIVKCQQHIFFYLNVSDPLLSEPEASSEESPSADEEQAASSAATAEVEEGEAAGETEPTENGEKADEEAGVEKGGKGTEKKE